MINIILTLIGLSIIIPIDAIYLFLNKNFYTKIIDQNEKINWIYAIGTWLLIIISIQLLVLPQVAKDLPQVAKDLPQVAKDLPQVAKDLTQVSYTPFINGLFLGLAMYGVYNLTSATLYPSKWDYKIIIGDTLWGMILTGTLSYILYKIKTINKY
jgi:hypothetical protein